MANIKQSRTCSFILVAVIYILAIVVGILSYLYIPLTSVWLKLLVADVLATIFTFIFSVIIGNASVYDPYWSVQPIIIVFAFAFVNGVNVSGILVLIAISVWGIRLTANWAYTFKGLNFQDWRYTMLKETTGKFYPLINFIGIHMVPTLIVYACTLPAVYVVLYKPNFNGASIIFLAVSFVAVLLQGTADVQMHKFRKNRTSTFITNGLWKYSRHPNYLGEILMWWGVGLYSVILMPNMWALLLGAFLNTVLFLSVSIPMADKRQSKKDGFSDYKAHTRMLLILPKR